MLYACAAGNKSIVKIAVGDASSCAEGATASCRMNGSDVVIRWCCLSVCANMLI